MSEEVQRVKTNDHLNLFNFYSQDENAELLENNVSRALAICLNNNRYILNDLIKKFILPENYTSLFSLDYDIINSEDVIIDIQRSANNINGNYQQIFGVTLTTRKYSKDEIDAQLPYKTETPITDIIIVIKDILIVIEVKTGGDIGSISQVKRQVEVIQRQVGLEDDINVQFKSFSWEEVLDSFTRVRDNFSEDDYNNMFIDDFAYYIMTNFPSWLPISLLSEVPYDSDPDSPNYKRINKRLDVIKLVVTKDYIKEEGLTDIGNRSAIPIDYNWASEANLYIDDNFPESIVLKIWPGDTKGQGQYIFTENKEIEWPTNNEVSGLNYYYKMIVTPYIKFSNWNRGIAWIEFDIEDDKGYLNTHSYDGFKKLAGRWKRESDAI